MNSNDESEDRKHQDTKQPARKRLLLGDSWFCSVNYAENIMKRGDHCTIVIKTTHVWPQSFCNPNPYEEMFPDKYINMYICHVVLPQVLSRCFKYSNKMDINYQVRILDFGLKKK